MGGVKLAILGTGIEATPTQLAVTGAVLVLGVWYLAHKTKQAAKEVAQAVNPLNQDNIFNTGFDAVYQSLTGSKDTLGADIADWIHGTN